MNELRFDSPRNTERGFYLSVRTAEEDEKAHVQLIHSADPQFYIRVWIPTAPSDTAPTGFIETRLPVSGHLLRLGVDCQSIVDNCLPLGEEGSSISLEAVQNACNPEQFERFLIEVLRPFRWKKLLTRIVKPKEIMPIVHFLRSNLSQWKGVSEERVYIPPTKQIPYPIEFNRATGAIWIYYTFNNREINEIQLFALNLENSEREELHQWVEYDLETGSRIASLNCFTTFHFGLLCFHDLFFHKKKYIGKYVAYDCDLLHFDIELTIHQKWAIGSQLLQGLVTLEEQGIVHCGIFPKSIYFRFRLEQQETKELFAVIGDFNAAYSQAHLPDLPIRSTKWAGLIPPECAETNLSKLQKPFAVPVFQLGLCLRLIFKGEETQEIQALLDKMVSPDPDMRGTAGEIFEVWRRSQPEADCEAKSE